MVSAAWTMARQKLYADGRKYPLRVIQEMLASREAMRVEAM